MRRLLALVLAPLLAGLFVGPAAAISLGVLTASSLPQHYGEPASFSWVLERKPHAAVLGIICYQDNKYAYVAELNEGRALARSDNWIVDQAHNTYSNLYLDETRPAYCTALVWDERANNTQIPLTGGISFAVDP